MGTPVDVIDVGTGPPVVLLHSSVSGNRQWKALIADLRDRHRVLAINLLGYGDTPPLTGSEALDMTDVAALASTLVGRAIRRVVVPDARYRSELLEQGLSEHAADLRVGLFAASRRGDFAPADPTLTRLLDRPTTTLAAFLDATLTPPGAKGP